MDLRNLDLGGLLEGFGNITETDDIPTIINEFAKLLAQLIEIIKGFFGGLGGTTTDPEATTQA